MRSVGVRRGARERAEVRYVPCCTGRGNQARSAGAGVILVAYNLTVVVDAVSIGGAHTRHGPPAGRFHRPIAIKKR